MKLMQVAKYINGPLTFYLDPPSGVRPRHRNHRVSSQIRVDSSGREHMIMSFYVQGSTPGPATAQDFSYWDRLSGWTHEKLDVLSELTFDEFIARTTERAAYVWDRSKGTFKYLIGAPVSPPPSPSPSDSKEPPPNEKKQGWGLMGLFSSLKGPRGGPAVESHAEPEKVFTEGEVHAHLVKVCGGWFAVSCFDLVTRITRDTSFSGTSSSTCQVCCVSRLMDSFL